MPRQSHLESLGVGEFKRRYLMSGAKFDSLLSMLVSASDFFKPVDSDKSRFIRNLYGHFGCDPRHKLVSFIRWCAGGSYLDIRLVHGMGRFSVYDVLWETVDAIHTSPELRIQFPWDDDEAMSKLEKGFSNLSHGKLRGCVFALDGLCIHIKCPIGVSNPRDYYNRTVFIRL